MTNSENTIGEVNKTYDVIIIGGSYAGLSAAMALGRSLRDVLIIDSNLPCNRRSPHSHNFITQDGEKPGDISRKAKAQVLKYETVSFHEDHVVEVGKNGDFFELTTWSGFVFLAKKILFATGLQDLKPDIAGFADCWGISIIHCPYCHGYEFGNQPTGILANGDMAFHYTQLVSNLTHILTIFTDGPATFSAEQHRLLEKNNVRIEQQEVKAFIHQNGLLSGLVLEDGAEHALNAIYTRPPFEQHCKIPVELGCELTEQGLLKVDHFQETTVPGIYACGDNSAMRSVPVAVSTGSVAGAAINMALCAAGFND